MIGTRATINSNSYLNGINSLKNENHDVNVYPQACPLFVPLVEEGWTRHPVARQVAEEYLNPLKEKDIDTLVLGCTHYPLLKQLIGDVLPNVSLIDSGEHASVTALRILAEKNLLVERKNGTKSSPKIDFYVTDLPAMFYELAGQFLGFPVESPEKVSIGSA